MGKIECDKCGDLRSWAPFCCDLCHDWVCDECHEGEETHSLTDDERYYIMYNRTKFYTWYFYAQKSFEHESKFNARDVLKDCDIIICNTCNDKVKIFNKNISHEYICDNIKKHLLNYEIMVLKQSLEHNNSCIRGHSHPDKEALINRDYLEKRILEM